MRAPQLADRARRRLARLLADDRPVGERWLARLREWGGIEGQPPFSNAVTMLFHLDVAEAQAEQMLRNVLVHRDSMTLALGRDPGLRVAGVDYLSNIEGRLINPRIVDGAAFERTERSARTDGLTKLLNRRAFKEVLEREIRRGRRYRQCLALAMLDLDRFKSINDEGGHLLGDLVLERFAALLRRAVREADFACRYGGEEFAIILPETDRRGAFVVAERVRTRVASAFRESELAGRRVTTTVSAGLACYPDDATGVADLVARADAALYLAKERGRNRVVAYHTERRRAFRYPARRDARLALRDSAHGRAISVRAVNVSLSGALFETELPLEVDTAVELLANEAGEEGDLRPLASGRVVRVESDPAAGVPSRAGVAFHQQIADDLLRGRLVSNVSSAGASRGVRR